MLSGMILSIRYLLNRFVPKCRVGSRSQEHLSGMPDDTDVAKAIGNAETLARVHNIVRLCHLDNEHAAVLI